MILFDKLCKFKAKFQLLEYGLVEAAHGVDDFIRSSETAAHLKKDKKGKGAKGKKKEEEEVEEEEEEEEVDEEEVESETLDGFCARINLYVLVNCSRASGSKHPTHKDALVYQTRKDLINEFLKSAILNKCQNEDCGW